MSAARDPIIVALDVGERRRLLGLARMLEGEVETLKIGLEAFTLMGPELVEELAGMGYRVFVDLKLHDIPHTVQGAVRGLVKRGAGMLTVHACGGRAMLAAAAEAAVAEAERMSVAPPLVLGVTVLTSLDDAALAEVGWAGGVRGQALSLARLCMDCGLGGVVSSAREAAALRGELGPQAVIVTPGIRPAGAERQDQVRAATPREAISAGVDYLVVGRPVIDHPRPVEAVRRIREEAAS